MIVAIDQTGDINGQQLYRLSKLYALPDFVKTASSESIYGNDQLETHQFADATSRQFPCHTPAATYISTLFFMDKRAELDEDKAKFIDSRLDDFAFVYGIGERITDLKTKLASDKLYNNEVELPDDAYALILDANESVSGKKERHYPMRNALEIKKCAEYLHNYKDEFPYKYRQKMASNILDNANKYGASLGDLDVFLEKQAGHGGAAIQEVGQFLFDRARLLKRAGKPEFAIKVAEIAKVMTNPACVTHDTAQLIKLACLVDDVDRETGLIRLIDDLPRPEDAFFGLTEKIASQIHSQHVTTVSGNTYKLTDFEKLKLAEIRDLMGQDFADNVSAGNLFVATEKLAEVMPTLQLSDAELLDNLLASVGIHPMAKQAAKEQRGFDTDELSALATLHVK